MHLVGWLRLEKKGETMDFDEAKEKLRDKYLELDLELVDEHPNELYLRHPRIDVLIKITEQEIADFCLVENLKRDLVTEPVECSISALNYREQIVDFLGHGPRRFFPFSRGIIFKENGDNIYVEIGRASDLFINYFRFDEAYLSISSERLRRVFPRQKAQNGIEMYELLYRPMTIRVQNIGAPTVETAIKRSSSLIEACLFELSYLREITLALVEEWPRRQPRNRPFRFGERFRGEFLPLPRAKFNEDTIRFYQRGMSTEDPVIQFLSFYHILEYFFVPISDEVLYARLSQRINDPKFSASRANLDRIIQDTLNHKRESDETEMLKRVLQKFVDESEIIEFIKAYEEYLGEHLYSRRRTIFGESVEVKLASGHVISNISKRIKIIRNALVHSSDRYERKQRYIPSSEAERKLEKEIPLMKFLAERVIIGSSV